MIQEHFAAVKNRLDGDPALTGKGSDTLKYDTTGQPVRSTYWVLAGGLDGLDDGRLSAPQSSDSDATYTFRFTMVSPDPGTVRAGLEKATGRLTGWSPTVTDRACRVELDPGVVEAATAILPPLYYGQIDITVYSNRA